MKPWKKIFDFLLHFKLLIYKHNCLAVSNYVYFYIFVKETQVMETFSKVTNFPYICAIDISLTGMVISDAGDFHSSTTSGALFMKSHFRKGDIQFSEQSEKQDAGVIYKQKLRITFNSSDSKRSKRMDLIHAARFVRITMTDDTEFIIGRNDYTQNRPLDVTVKSDLQTSTIEFYAESITPLTKYNQNVILGFPGFIPVILGL